MKKTLIAASIAAIVPAIAWLCGYDFDRRGTEAAAIAVLTLAVFVIVFAHPEEHRK